ncbi:hypothetical protein PV10_02099 [Exophiala mesophila]|uniref:DUF3835 domain-containing protein n=1 Tax=Exophiala mesophila TaxID=212818 RepID=A0A0D1WXX8_EXOME|nr:uncharacterized protein PV10_02099 [Exophiala mesophila]KIV94325.1 hypothetical protein PV10_02099 [Exophiala mesophila]
MDESALARVDAQRVELEANIAKLRKSLRHWQTLEIDYEGLKEEFMALDDAATIDECMQIGLDFKAELVDEQELHTLLRDSSARPRKPSQLAEVLSKRVDYVVHNVDSLRKQLSDAEKKRNALLLVGDPDHRDDAGLPLAEITEELDDSGNIISSKVKVPGSDTDQLVDVLKKAGIQDLETRDGVVSIPNPPSTQGQKPSEIQESVADSSTVANYGPSQHSKVGLSEVGDTEEEAALRSEIMDYRNGLDDVGAIVAELDLEEEGSDISFDENDVNFEIDPEFDEDDDDDEDDLGSEDESGRSTDRLHLSKSYQRKMEELQVKLGLKNVGPEGLENATLVVPAKDERPPAAEAARKAALARQEEALKSNPKASEDDAKTLRSSIKKNGKAKKSVAFSSELDIAPQTLPIVSKPINQSQLEDRPKARPIADTIIERPEAASLTGDGDEDQVPVAPSTIPLRQSRFKSARQGQSGGFNVVPNAPQYQSLIPHPPSQVISPMVVERTKPNDPKAPDDDDFDEGMHRAEINSEYQRHRIRRILAQDGGFVGNGEDDVYGEEMTPPMEDGRKISRFKAARLNR